MKSFLDSSALAKRYVEERGSSKVEEILQQSSSLGVSVLCLPEIVSALCRRRRERLLGARLYRTAKSALLRDFDAADVVQLTGTVLAKAIDLLEGNPLRAMDALHVACALEWNADTFVSSDVRQLKTAAEAGLSTMKV